MASLFKKKIECLKGIGEKRAELFHNLSVYSVGDLIRYYPRNPEYWVAVVKPGRVMFELGGVDEATAREAMRLAANKLPIKCKFVTKEVEQ